MATAEYKVNGMTCGHCAAAVEQEVAAIDGVTEVEVDLDAGQLQVTGDAASSTDAIRAAVEEAGYELVS